MLAFGYELPSISGVPKLDGVWYASLFFFGHVDRRVLWSFSQTRTRKHKLNLEYLATASATGECT